VGEGVLEPAEPAAAMGMIMMMPTRAVTVAVVMSSVVGQVGMRGVVRTMRVDMIGCRVRLALGHA
jgi:hypothetical protein